MNPEYRWWCLDGVMPALQNIARDRDEQKGGYESTKNWTVGGSTHFVGVCSECCVELETGLPFDKTLKASGDDGGDFTHGGKTYDAKGATFWTSPDMKEFTNRKKHADFYILCAVKDLRFVKVVGWASREQLIASKQRDYRYGKRFSLTHHELAAFGQLGLPPTLPRRDQARLDLVEVNLARKVAAKQAA